MRLVIQRVKSASVSVDGKIVGSISQGLMVLVGFHQSDTNPDLETASRKLIEMRIFSNDRGRFDHSVQDIGGSVLLVPQFTLFAKTDKGRRPDFFEAAKPDLAKAHFARFVATVEQAGVPVASGTFGAEMQVELINDGPVTIILDT